MSRCSKGHRNGHSRTSEEDEEDRLRVAQRILLESTPPDRFDGVLSDLLKVAPNLSEGWAEEMRSEHLRRREKISDGAHSATSRVATAWDSFFHSRTGSEGCVLAACIRMAFAAIFVADRLLLTLDFSWLFSSAEGSEGMIAYMPQYMDDGDHSVFWLTPRNGWLLWTVHLLGILQAVLLFLGIAPRFQAFCIFLNLVNFHNYCDMIYDSQDILQRTWAWMLCFLPLHRLTVYEWRKYGGMSPTQRRERFRNDSWPMWPFRLFQIQICFIFIGAGLSKLTRPVWRDGTAMYRAVHTDNFFGGLFTPEIVFNRVLPLKIVTFVSLFLECTCFIFIWPEASRTPMLTAMVLFHVGIDLSMNLNMFQWNMILGWLMFLVKPSSSAAVTKKVARVQSSKGILLNLFLAAFIIFFYVHTSPDYFLYQRESPLPRALRPYIRYISRLRIDVHSQYIDPLLSHLGLWQQTWSMYHSPDHTNERVDAYIQFYNGSGVEWSQPDWKSMPWWQKKRYHRQMHYWTSITEDSCELCVKPLCLHLARMHGGLDDVKSVELRARYERAPPYPDGLGWFDEVKQPMVKLEDDFMFKWRNERRGDRKEKSRGKAELARERRSTEELLCRGNKRDDDGACFAAPKE